MLKFQNAGSLPEPIIDKVGVEIPDNVHTFYRDWFSKRAGGEKYIEDLPQQGHIIKKENFVDELNQILNNYGFFNRLINSFALNGDAYEQDGFTLHGKDKSGIRHYVVIPNNIKSSDVPTVVIHEKGNIKDEQTKQSTKFSSNDLKVLNTAIKDPSYADKPYAVMDRVWEARYNGQLDPMKKYTYEELKSIFGYDPETRKDRYYLFNRYEPETIEYLFNETLDNGGKIKSVF